MANVTLIQQKLPQDLWNFAAKFTIPDNFLENEPDLVVLVLKSRSLSKDEEKQSWFNLVPMMNQEQIEKLRDILTRERDKIAEIEAKYEQKKNEIQDKYQTKFDAVAYQNKMTTLKSDEAQQREKEAEEVENLFDDL
jgi:hypothetical protein